MKKVNYEYDKCNRTGCREFGYCPYKDLKPGKKNDVITARRHYQIRNTGFCENYK